MRPLVDATELERWAVRAAWDDLEPGLKHGNEFEKTAIHGNRSWQVFLSKIGGWFISREVRYIESEAEAIAWLAEWRSSQSSSLYAAYPIRSCNVASRSGSTLESS